MAVISIFSGIYCQEEAVVRELVGSTGYGLVMDKDIISEASRMSGISTNKIERTFSSKTSVFNRFTHEREHSIAHLRLALAKRLYDDNLIIEGFITHLIPREVTHVLRLCMIADLKFRISVAAREQGLAETEAGKVIKKMDGDRAAWVHILFNVNDPWDASLYDIVIPTHNMDEEEIMRLIRENMNKEVLNRTNRTRKAVDDFFLSAQVEVALVTRSIDNANIQKSPAKALLKVFEDNRKSVLIVQCFITVVMDNEIKGGFPFGQKKRYGSSCIRHDSGCAKKKFRLHRMLGDLIVYNGNKDQGDK